MGQAASNNGTGGIGFMGLLTILLIGLKLTGHITWSWLWVLSPLWIVLGMFIFLVVFIVLLKDL